jgi:peptidylprolyl isomerase
VIRLRTRGAALRVLLGGLAAAPGLAFGAETETERLAEIAMLEDTRCPDGRQVTAFLQASSPAVRGRAALALARLQDSTTVDDLGGVLLGDKVVEVRREAAFALGQIGHRSALAPLSTAAERDSDLEVRALALEALGKVGDARGTPICVAALAARETELRREGALALWRIADPRAQRPLTDALRDPDPEVRWGAAYALEKMADTAAVVRAMASVVGDSSARVRAYAARTLGRMRSRLGTGLLLDLLEDPDLAVRVNAARSLGQIADSSAVPQLLSHLADPHPYVRESAAAALGQIGDAMAAPAVREAGADPESGVRAATATTLSRLLAGEEARRALEPFLADRESYVRAQAASALGRLSDPESEADLVALLGGKLPGGGKAEARERAAAASALGERKAAGARSALVSALDSGDAALVASAAEALGAMGASDSATVAALEAAARASASPNEPDIAVGVLEALATLKATAALPLGVELLRSPQVQTREAARKLVRALVSEEEAARLEAENAPPAWKPAALAPYRTAPPAARRAVLETSRGRITLDLFSGDAPRTVANFVQLAEKGYFDGTVFHRVVPNFVIQDGDPTRTGWGGPGYAIRCEYNRHRYRAGALGMALAGKDTGGSQFFLTHSPQPHLDGRYTVFGQVRTGMDVVQRVQVGDGIERVRLER